MKINICYCIAYAEAEVDVLPEVGGHVTLSDGDSFLLLEDLRKKVSPEVHDELMEYLRCKQGFWYDWKVNNIEDRNGRIIYHLEPALPGIFDRSEPGTYSDCKAIGERYGKEITRMSSREVPSLPGIPTGYASIDDVLGGFRDNDFIVIGGQPSSGKTSLALNILKNVAVDDRLPVLFFSLESSAEELTQRLICLTSNIEKKKLEGREMLEPYEWEQLDFKTRSLIDAPIYIEERPELSIGHIKNIVREQKKKRGIRLVIIDYMQLIRVHASSCVNREQEMSYVSRELKALAKECRIPIVAVSSLSRKQPKAGTPRPELSDLRDSGSIEFEADVVMLLHTPELDRYWEYPEDPNKLEIIIAKNRDGKCCDLDFRFLKEAYTVSE